MSDHGKCFWCDHEFDADEATGRGHTTKVTYSHVYGGGTYESTDHERDRREVSFLPGIFLCKCCVSEANKYQNKLGKFDHRSESIKALDREIERRRKAALEKAEGCRFYNPQTYVHPSLADYYRKVQSGKIDIGLKVAVRLVEDGRVIKPKGLVKGASVRTMDHLETALFRGAFQQRLLEMDRAELRQSEERASAKASQAVAA